MRGWYEDRADGVTKGRGDEERHRGRTGATTPLGPPSLLNHTSTNRSDGTDEGVTEEKGEDQ